MEVCECEHPFDQHHEIGKLCMRVKCECKNFKQTQNVQIDNNEGTASVG